MPIRRPTPVSATAAPQFLLLLCGSEVGGRAEAGQPGPWGALLLLGGHRRDSDQRPPGMAGSEPSGSAAVQGT